MVLLERQQEQKQGGKREGKGEEEGKKEGERGRRGRGHLTLFQIILLALFMVNIPTIILTFLPTCLPCLP